MKPAQIFLFFLLSLSTGRAAEAKSFYSTTADKFVALVESDQFDEEPGIDHFKAICPGYGGYELIFEGGDLRSWINVRHGDSVSEFYSETMTRARGMFPNKANDVVEWRGIVDEDTFNPYAIIYRVSATDPANESRQNSTLIVIGLKNGKAEIIGSAHGEGEDAKAKGIADRWWVSQK